jgi:hypothetical protein
MDGSSLVLCCVLGGVKEAGAQGTRAAPRMAAEERVTAMGRGRRGLRGGSGEMATLGSSPLTQPHSRIKTGSPAGLFPWIGSAN